MKKCLGGMIFEDASLDCFQFWPFSFLDLFQNSDSKSKTKLLLENTIIAK